MQITQPGATAADVVYTQTGIPPEVWGTYATVEPQMFLYNRSSGIFNFNANINNSSCGTTFNVPFSITLSPNSTFAYSKIFIVAPNPVVSNATVGINGSNPSNPFLTACIGAGATIRVTITSALTGAPFGVFNGSPTVNINMSGYPTGIYIFRVEAIGCPNSGIYQELHTIIKN